MKIGLPKFKALLASPGVDSLVQEKRKTNPNTIYQNHHSDLSELSNAFEGWSLELFNDSINTRSYICLFFVTVADLSEDDFYKARVQTQDHGEAVIGEYS